MEGVLTYPAPGVGVEVSDLLFFAKGDVSIFMAEKINQARSDLNATEYTQT